MNQEEIKEKNRLEKEGLIKNNNQGLTMKLLKYNSTKDILVEFEDGTLVNSSWGLFKRGSIKKPEIRLGMIVTNKDDESATVVIYNSYSDVTIEFNDKWRGRVHTTWNHIKEKSFKNPYAVNKHGGIKGDKYPIQDKNTGKLLKEYRAWINILYRCNTKDKSKCKTYINAKVCDEWIYYWNFYEWVHEQENFKQWLNGDSWAVDKDILVKGNKVYSPQTCCLVPQNINNLLLKSENTRGLYPIGVTLRKSDLMYEAQCMNPIEGRYVTIGIYSSVENAFTAYKKYKESIVKNVAQKEYDNNNITKECYDALLKYEVEITD